MSHELNCIDIILIIGLRHSNDISLNLIRNDSFDLLIEFMASNTDKTMLLSQFSNVYGRKRLTAGIKQG